MATEFVDNDYRDEVLNNLLLLPENKVILLRLTLTGVLRLHAEKPQVVLVKHRSVPMLPVHVQASLNGSTYLICSVSESIDTS